MEQGNGMCKRSSGKARTIRCHVSSMGGEGVPPLQVLLIEISI